MAASSFVEGFEGSTPPTTYKNSSQLLACWMRRTHPYARGDGLLRGPGHFLPDIPASAASEAGPPGPAPTHGRQSVETTVDGTLLHGTLSAAQAAEAEARLAGYC